MKISINELRSLVRQAVATQIMESAPKKKPTNKTLTAESKKISVNELRSMIKETIMNEIDPKEKDRIVQKVLEKLPKEFKTDYENKFGEDSLEKLIGALFAPTKPENKLIIIGAKNAYSSLNFGSVKELQNSLKKWIPGSEKIKASDKKNEDEIEITKTEPVYQTGETTYEEIAKTLDVTKQAVEKIIKDAERNFYNIVALLSANKKIKDEEVSSDLKTIKKANLKLKLKKSLIEAIAEAATVVTEKVLNEAENFIDKFNEEMIQKNDLAAEDYDSLTEEEQTKINKRIQEWFSENGILSPKIEEYSFMIDLLNSSDLEENKKILTQLFFLVDEFKTRGSVLARIAKMFHDKIRDEISSPFNPETRGRGGIDPIIMQKLKDNDLLDSSEAEV